MMQRSSCHPRTASGSRRSRSRPAGLPDAVVTRLHAAIQESLDDANFVKRLNDLGFAIQKRSTADFQKFVRKQVTGWGPAVKASGAKLN
jgi:tripartite-type tricarboxylate transporter receptor subunit TctC